MSKELSRPMIVFDLAVLVQSQLAVPLQFLHQFKVPLNFFHLVLFASDSGAQIIEFLLMFLDELFTGGVADHF